MEKISLIKGQYIYLITLLLLLTSCNDNKIEDTSIMVKDLKLDNYYLTLNLDSERLTDTISIISGNGGYIAESSDKSIVKTVLFEEKIIITAIKEGTVSVSVSDQQDKNAKIQITILKNGNSTEGPYKSSRLNKLAVGTPEFWGAPINDLLLEGNCTVKRASDGAHIVYAATMGSPATFFVYNLDKRVVEIQIPLEITEGGDYSGSAYAVDVDYEGMVNIVGNGVYFFRYNPKTGILKKYDKVFSETAVMNRGYVDPENNDYYFGTYPNAKLIRYNKAADKLEDLGRMMNSGEYVRAVTGLNGIIYMGGIGDPTAEFVAYNTKTNQKTTIQNPSLAGIFSGNDVVSYSAITNIGYLLGVKYKTVTFGVTKEFLSLYDPIEQKWLEFIEKAGNTHTTDLVDNVFYFLRNDPTIGKRVIHSYNINTKKITSYPGLEFSSFLRSPIVLGLNDQINYPGKTIVAGGSEDGIVLLNLQNQQVTKIKSSLPSTPSKMRVIKAGLNNDLILSVYKGSFFSVIELNEKKSLEIDAVQLECINTIGGKYYLGIYGSGALRVYDPDKSVEEGINPIQIAHMSAERQSRSMVIEEGANGDIVWGTIPDYGVLGGAVGIYNISTKHYRKYNNIIPNQSIGGLAYKNGVLYGATHIWGGLGITPIDEPAHLFKMDYNTGQITQMVKIELSTDRNRQYFGGSLRFATDGTLWLATVKTLVQINPSTLEIIKEISIGSGIYTVENSRFVPWNIVFDKNGLIFTDIGYRISAVDVDTGEVKRLLERGTNSFDLANDGNLYYLGSDLTELWKISLGR